MMTLPQCGTDKEELAGHLKMRWIHIHKLYTQEGLHRYRNSQPVFVRYELLIKWYYLRQERIVSLITLMDEGMRDCYITKMAT